MSNTLLSSFPREPVILHGEEHAVHLDAFPDGWWMLSESAGLKAWGLGPREAEVEFSKVVREAREAT